MKNLLKNILKITSICFFFSMTSCEKDLYDNAIKEQNNSPYKFRKVNIDEVPNIKTLVEQKIGSDYKIQMQTQTGKASDTIINGVLVLKDHVFELINNNGEKSYSFETYAEYPTTDRYNYVIQEKDGIIKYNLIKYNCNLDWLIGKNGKFIIDEFTGIYEVYDDSGTLVIQQNMKDGLGIPCPPGGSSSTGGGGSTGTVDPVSPGDYDPLSGGGGFICGCCGQATTAHYFDGTCDQIPIYISNLQKTANNNPCVNIYIPYPADDGVSIANNVPIIIPFIVLYKTNFVFYLLSNEKNFLLTHHELNNSIMEYLLQKTTSNNIDSAALAFAKQVVTQAMTAPDLFTSITPFLVEKQINDNQLNPCPKGVFQEIKNTSNSDLVKVLTKLGDNKSVYNTTLLSSIAPSGAPAQTIRNSNFNYSIYISTDYVGKTKLFIAANLFHELIHAYFLSIVDDYNSNPNNNQYYYNMESFPSLFQAYCDKKYPLASGESPNIHHLEMAHFYVDTIARALQEYQTNIPVSDTSTPEQIYIDLAWGGLINTPVFDDPSTPLTSADKNRIMNRYICEQTGIQSASGTLNQQNPIGQPCN